MIKAVCLFLLAFMLAGCCGSAEPASMKTEPPGKQTLQAPALEAEAAALTEEVIPPTGVVLEPVAPGIREERSNAAVVDYSNAEEGYIMAFNYGQTEKCLKLLLKGPSTIYNYDLPQGQWIVLPLSDGNGNYQAGIYRNIRGTEYAMVMMAEFSVTLEDEFAPFLRPNQYVNYVDAPDSMALGAELCYGLEHPLDKVATVYDYVVTNLSYDYEKAATVKSGYLPELDNVLEAKKGICFDYAALMTAMLRSQEVPCKLVVGYAGQTYHSWISVWTEENGWVDGAIFFDGTTWQRMDPTFASSGKKSESIMKYIGNGANYTAKYLY